MGCSSSVAAKDVVCPDLSKAPVTPSTQPRNLDLVTQSQLADRIHSNEPRAVFRLPPLPGGEAAIEPQCSLPPPRPTRRRKALHPDRGDRGEVDGAAPIPVTDNVLSGLVDVDRQLMAHTRVSEYYKLETGPVQVGDPEEDDDISGWCAGLGALDSEPIEAPEIESNGDAVESENPPSNRPSLVLSSSRPSLGSQALLDQRDSKILQVVRRSFVKENTDEKRLSSYFIVHPRHDLEETVRSSKYFKEPGEDATNNEHLSSLEVEVSEILHQSPRNSFVKMIRTSFTAGNRDPDGPVLIDPGIATPRFSIYSDCSSNHAELAAKISAPPSTRNSMLYSEHAQQASDLEQGECNQPGNDLGREPNQEIVCSDDLTELELPERLSHLSIRASSYYGEEAHPVQGLSEAEVNEALQWGLLCVAGDSVISVSKPEEKPAKEFRISYMAQTGYYPDQDQRLSQDTWCIAKDVGGVSGCHFVAVLDGHGPWGTECAAFARNSLLEALAENKALTNNTDSILMGIKMAHQKVKLRSYVSMDLSI